MLCYYSKWHVLMCRARSNRGARHVEEIWTEGSNPPICQEGLELVGIRDMARMARVIITGSTAVLCVPGGATAAGITLAQCNGPTAPTVLRPLLTQVALCATAVLPQVWASGAP